MKRLTVALVALAGAVGVARRYTVKPRPRPEPDWDRIRSAQAMVRDIAAGWHEPADTRPPWATDDDGAE